MNSLLFGKSTQNLLFPEITPIVKIGHRAALAKIKSTHRNNAKSQSEESVLTIYKKTGRTRDLIDYGLS